ncbi:Tn7 transposase TnsA N-terminal domain-containing protein [Acinetobacter lwoffii]|uniref:Tn7 transposase TnsA N-terminal domain-containing protein n=1 Tax=Acinetobacter lwoffii TaxID=28090 RepID=UPI001FB33A93|nr:Tn7 transposase TnsA N-terminal domain-containing protein [Acinetobacter lwoffii]MCJ0928628.1 Tn7 transposase TnsA N-terminal domain-containing protein [Acinetobacter lwoffii]
MPYQAVFSKTDIQTNILEQIRIAFESTANVAATLHGKRKIYQGAFGRRTSLFPSKKCCGSIPLESRLELAHAVSLEKDPNILNYRSQALKILLINEQYYFPDFLIQTKKGNYEVHEVKPSIASLSIDELNRFAILSDLLHSIDITFKLIDHTDLPNESEISQLLYWYQRGHRFNWNNFEINYALEQLTLKEFDNSTQVYRTLESIGLKPELADYLFFHQKITINSDKQKSREI